MTSIRRTSAQWQQILQEQEQSGLSIKEYCQQNNIATSCFFKWRGKLTQPSSENISVTEPENEKWLPLEKDIPPTNVWDLELSLPNGIVLRMKHV
ncbi:MAG: hypothetical protein HRT38_16965 [Alteromonadaceae bacterium]|nr:hypothetical protein [Alteromonadaceae bacterium]